MKDVSPLKNCLSIFCAALAGLILALGAGCAGEKQIEVYTVPADAIPPDSWYPADPFGPEKARFTISDANGTAYEGLRGDR